MRRLLLLLLYLIYILPSQAQNLPWERYNMTQLDLFAGMSSDYVDDIFQDTDGFMWISTNGGGLLRYDGYSFVNFGLSGMNGLRLRSNFCKNVTQDRQGRLWVALVEGLQVVDLRAGQTWTPVTTDDRLSKALRRLFNKPCMRVYCDTKGCIWVLTFDEISRIAFDGDGRVCSLLSLRHQTKVPELALEDLDHDGSVYTGINFRPTKVEVRGGRLVARDLCARYPQLKGAIIGAVVRFHGQLWWGTNIGLYNSDPRNSGWHADGTPRGLQHNIVTSLAVSTDNRYLLIGTLCGIDIMDSKRGELYHWNEQSSLNPLSSNFVNNILVTHGQIWVGTETGGITKLSPRPLLLQNFAHMDDNPQSISPNSVNAMYADHEGNLWVGTVEGGLNMKQAGSDNFIHFTTANSGLTHNSVSDLTADGKGNLWIGTWGGGICVRSAKDHQIHFLRVPQPYQNLITFIGALVYDPYNKGMWIGANSGVFFYDMKTGRIRDPFAGNRDINGCIGSIVTKDGQMLMGCLTGLISVNLKARRDRHGFFPMHHQIYKLDHPETHAVEKAQSFCQSRDGSLWIGSNGYGLYRLTERNGHLMVKNYTSADGLPNNSVKGIVEDRSGKLWLATVNGLACFDPKAEKFSTFTTDDGLLSNQFYFNGAIIDRRGTIWLGSDRGLTAVYGHNRQSVYPGHLCFTALMVNNQYVLPTDGHTQTTISEAKEVRFHESDRSFTFEFSAMNYGSETQGVYSYRMKGYEDDWMPLPPGEHSVRYSTLPAGHYTFEVRYTPSVGSTQVQEASIDVYVRPYFWKSWWFISLVVLALIILSRYIYLRRLEEMRNREVEELYRPIEAALRDSEDAGKLQVRIQEILKTQERYQQSQQKTVAADKKEVVEKRIPFMEKVMAVMEQRYGDSAFGVQELADTLGCSRATLSHNLQSEVGCSTSQFMRDYRLDIAKRLLQENVAERNITEIAYRVGFNDPKYFTRCFSKKFGVSPSSFR